MNDTNLAETQQQVRGMLMGFVVSLHRLLRALASFGVFEERADGRYANTPRSECLRLPS